MFSVCSSDVHYIQWSRTGLHFLGENIIGNINVHYFELEPVIQGDMCLRTTNYKNVRWTPGVIQRRRPITKTHPKAV